MDKSGRIIWLDAARGLAIIFVVIGHVERGLVSAHVTHGPGWAWLDYTIYTFHMPAFFLFAGITAAISLSRKAPGPFLGDKVWTIAYPYFLWSITQGLIMYALSHLTNSKETLRDVLTIGWRPIGQFWFLYVLMVFQIFGVIAYRAPRIAVVASALLYVAAAALPMPDLLHNICHFIIFYTCGFLDIAAIAAYARLNLASVAFCAAGFVCTVYLSGVFDHENYYSIFALPSTVFGVGLVIVLAQSVNRWLIALGSASMTIYVLHILCAAGARIMLKLLHVHMPVLGYLIACSIVGIILPLTIHEVLKSRGMLATFGLAARPKARIPEGGIQLSPSSIVSLGSPGHNTKRHGRTFRDST